MKVLSIKFWLTFWQRAIFVAKKMAGRCDVWGGCDKESSIVKWAPGILRRPIFGPAKWAFVLHKADTNCLCLPVQDKRHSDNSLLLQTKDGQFSNEKKERIKETLERKEYEILGTKKYENLNWVISWMFFISICQGSRRIVHGIYVHISPPPHSTQLQL